MEGMTAVIAHASTRMRWGGIHRSTRCWRADSTADAFVVRKPAARTTAWHLIASEGVGNE
jgi:hypothetical protein